jgi:two-component system alkaline phosphatase synthesis response regulator PhoP
MKQQILVADDEPDVLEFLKYNLEKEGYGIVAASNGADALAKARRRPNLILLDVMMPEMDGYEVLRSLKKNPATESIPVMFLTAKSGELDEVLGLELGANDYVVKPISIPKLIARIKNILRKQSAGTTATAPERNRLTVGNVTIVVDERQVIIDRIPVQFPKKEFDVLHFFFQNPGKVISRETLLHQVWGSDVYVVDRTVDVHVRKIREKLGTHAEYIETLKGVGYRLRDDI